MSRVRLISDAIAILNYMLDLRAPPPALTVIDFHVAMFSLERSAYVVRTSVVPTDKYRSTITWEVTSTGRAAWLEAKGAKL